jgi:outer membrane protein OmpA-like peptidoglycan-associated protein
MHRPPSARPDPLPSVLIAVVMGIVGLGLGPERADPQALPALGGVEIRAGLTFPQDANVAASAFGELDVGYVWRPPLRVLLGLSVYEANIDREGGGDEGSFRATGAWASGRYDLFPRRALAPYVRAGLTLQRVRADAFDVNIDALLDGVYVGAAAGIGARYVLDARGRLSATAELRRTFMSNVANTALELGLRFQRRGLDAYVPDRATLAARRAGEPGPRWAAAPMPDTAADRRLAELERAALEAERALAAARDAPAPAPPPARAPTPDAAVPPPAVAAPAPPVPAVTEARRREAVEAMFRQGLARAAASMGAVTRLEETATEFVLILGGGLFGSGAATLAGPARDEMRVLATVLAGYPGHIIQVEGHTDAVGDAASNQRLSEQRAATVRAALIAEGVDPLWVGSRGLGARRPLATNQTPAGRATNRRVEIRASKQLCPEPPLTSGDGGLVCRF